MSIVLRELRYGALSGADVSFEPGLHVVLGTEQDGTGALAELISGMAAPRRGSVRVADLDPRRSPATRRRIGVLFAEERASAHRSLGAAAAEALSLRGESRDPSGFLAEYALASFSATAPGRVPPEVLRQLALALALSVPSPLALVLIEPLATGAHTSRESVRFQLAALAKSGATVVACTASVRDAAELGGSLLLLDRGRFVRRPALALPTELTPASALTLRVTTTDARGVAARLASDKAVSGVKWRDASDEIAVTGADANALSLAVMSAVRAQGATVSAIEPALPTLDEIRGASSGLWRGAYDAAYRLARAHAEARAKAAPFARVLPGAEAQPAPSVPPSSNVPPAGTS